MPSAPRAVPDEEWLAALKTEDPLRLILGAHNLINDALAVLLAEALPDPDMPELGRLAFNTRVDLLLAMGLIRAALRPAFRDFNSLRNTFAHDAAAMLTEARAKQLRAAIPDELVPEPEKVVPLEDVAVAASIMWVHVTRRLSDLRDKAAESEYIHGLVVKMTAGKPARRDAGTEAYVKRARAERTARGEH